MSIPDFHILYYYQHRCYAAFISTTIINRTPKNTTVEGSHINRKVFGAAECLVKKGTFSLHHHHQKMDKIFAFNQTPWFHLAIIFLMYFW